MQRLSPKEIFTEGNISANIARKSFRGGVSTIGAQVVKMVLRIGATVILARLLTPADYGLIGMVTVVVNFAGMFKDAGLSMATVQKGQISHEQISNLFWINVLISAVLGVCVLLAAPLVTWFYGKSELTKITAVLSLSFVLSGLAIQHAALLRRHMRFGELAIIQIVSQFLSVVVTIILALYGFRYWALVGGILVGSLITLLLTYYFCPWVPGRIQKKSGTRNMLRFGGHLTGANFVGYLSRNADNILIGRFIGVDALGVYGRAYSLFMMPISQIRAPITSVAMPALSSLKTDPPRYLKCYRAIIEIMATCAIPLCVYSVVEGEFIVRLLLGEQWMGAVPVFRILAVAGVVQSISGTRGLVLLSHGFSKRYLKLSLVVGSLVVVSFIIGLPFGITGVAISYTIFNLVILIPSLHYCFSGTPIRVSLFLKIMILPLAISAFSAILAASVFLIPAKSALWLNILFGIVFFALYFLFSMCRKSIREMFSQVKRIL